MKQKLIRLSIISQAYVATFFSWGLLEGVTIMLPCILVKLIINFILIFILKVIGYNV